MGRQKPPDGHYDVERSHYELDPAWWLDQAEHARRHGGSGWEKIVNRCTRKLRELGWRVKYVGRKEKRR